MEILMQTKVMVVVSMSVPVGRMVEARGSEDYDIFNTASVLLSRDSAVQQLA